MEIRSLDRAALGPENEFSQKLLPWPALNAPFKGAWCVIHPKSSSVRHAHEQYEIFIAISGAADLESNGERIRFRKGDVVHFPPFTEHQVINDGTEDFEMYAVWWDSDTATTFAARDRTEK